MAFDPNPLFYYMASTYAKYKTADNKIVFCNEGASRAGKTQDAFHLIEVFCSHAKKPLTIAIFRNTLKDSRTKAYKDFKKYLEEIRGIYDPNKARCEHTSPVYNLHGSLVEFKGLDEETEQTDYDIVFVNEALEVDSESKIAGLKLRCNKLMIFDWNPKYTQHWIFEWEGRPDIYFTKTTYKNNKHCPKQFITEIESESPWMLEDLKKPEAERRPHKENIERGTVDKWHFEVYGMGMRSNRDGLVFPSVTWIDEFPPENELDLVFYGLDFGFTQDPSAFVKLGFKSMGEGKRHKVYHKLMIYEPTATADLLYDKMKSVEPNLDDYNVWADCSAPLMITDLRAKGVNIFAVTDKQIVYGVDLMNRFDIHLVHDLDVKKEQENYCYDSVHGIQINEPIDKHNHFWDASRYGYMSQLRRYVIN